MRSRSTFTAAATNARRTLIALLAAAGAWATLAADASADYSARDGRKIPITSLGYSAGTHVSGQPGRVKNVRVTFDGVTHKDGDDLDVVLVGPNGDSTLIVSDACDGELAGRDWTFDADAAGGLTTDVAGCASGTYRATNHGFEPDAFPGGPTISSQPASMLNFVGVDPNGLWRLFVSSDDAGTAGTGTIEGGWSLRIETAEADAVVPGFASGAASVYPLGRVVQGMTGVVTDVDVTLPSVTHRLAADMDMVLVSPRGTAVRLLAGACAGAARGARWTFDDEASAPAPATQCAADGRYRPTTAKVHNTPLPAPGPAAADIADKLSAFDGTDPNGEWKLFVNDTYPAYYDGALARPTIDLTVRPGADVSLTDPAASVTEGDTRTLTVTRAGDAAQLGPGSVKVATVAGTATPGEDFAPVSTVVEFARGQAARTVDVQVLADAAAEPLEVFWVELSAPADDAALGTATRSMISIPAQEPPVQGGGDQTPTPAPTPTPGDDGAAGGGGAGAGGGSAGGGGGTGGVSGADGLAPTLRALRVARSHATFTLSERARVRMTVQRIRPGRKAKRIGAVRTVQATPGRNRIRMRRLKPGRYRLTVVATDAAGNAGKAVRTSFSVKRKGS